MLKNYAVTVQKSVFETFLKAPKFDEMLEKISRLIDSSVDSVRIYAMTREAQRKMKVFGMPGMLEDPAHFFVNQPEIPIDSFESESPEEEDEEIVSAL